MQKEDHVTTGCYECGNLSRLVNSFIECSTCFHHECTEEQPWVATVIAIGDIGFSEGNG